MKKIGLWVIAASCVLVHGLSAAPVAVLLEQGIYTEETVGDLPRAIEIYSEIVADEQANRKVVAEALLRLGRCQAEEGNIEEALDHLHQLTQRYPAAKQFVKKAELMINELTPKPLIPELQGCYLKYTIKMDLGVQPSKSKAFPIVYYPGDLSQVEWTVAPELEERVERFGLFLVPEDDAQMVVPYQDELPKNARSIPPQQADEMHIGRHTVRLVAYDADGNELTRSEQAIMVKPALYTQINVNDLQPNGDIRFVSVTQTPNMWKEIQTKSFINSDFVHIESMFDENGDEVEFNETHQGKHYRYQVALNKPVYKGQTLYSGSKGWSEGLVNKVAGREDEYHYSMNHSPGTKTPTRRIEIFRLPKGAELLETGLNDLPSRVCENGRVEVLIDTIIPAKGSLLTQFTYRLTDAVARESSKLNLLPAPWKDGETLEYRLVMKTGVEVGRQYWMAHQVLEDGSPRWSIEQRLLVPVANQTTYSAVLADKDSFAPIRSRTVNMLGDVSAVYGAGTVSLRTADKDMGDHPFKGMAFDNEQALYVMRCLPLAAGYRGSFPIVSVMAAGKAMECRINVTRRETVEVSAGSFDCWKIELAVYADGVKAIAQDFWYSVDGQIPVKMDVGHLDIELVRTQIDREITLPESAGTVSLPEGWLGYTSKSLANQSAHVQFLPPEMKMNAALYSKIRNPDSIGLQEIVHKDLEELNGYFKSYTVREGSMVEKTINGLPAYIYAADYEDQREAKVEYRAYYATETSVYWFAIRLDADQFDAAKAELDVLINGLNID